MTDNIILLPEANPDSHPEAVIESTTPIEISDFAVFTFARRLDSFGFSFLAATIFQPGEKCYLYKWKFPQEFSNQFDNRILFYPTSKGRILYLKTETFQVLDSEDVAIPIPDGNWPASALKFQKIGALHHLGIIPDLSVSLFQSSEEQLIQWTNSLHKVYGTHGSLEQSLQLLFIRILFSLRFFCFPSDVTKELSSSKLYSSRINIFYGTFHSFLSFPDSSNSTNSNQSQINFCFGSLINTIKNSHEIRIMTQILPELNFKSPFLILLKFYELICHSLDSSLNIDNYADVINALHVFQSNHNIQIDLCTLRTALKIIYLKNQDLNFNTPLPLFSKIGIELTLDNEPEFNYIEPIRSQSVDSYSKLTEEEKVIVDSTRDEFNRALSGIDSPKERVEWLQHEIIATVSAGDKKCQELSNRLHELESNKLMGLNRLLKDMNEESNSALARIKGAASILNDFYSAQSKIPKKFEGLRDQLYHEQKNSHIIMFMGIFFALIGFLHVFTYVKK